MARRRAVAQIAQVAEQNLLARDSYRSTATLAILTLVWIGAVMVLGIHVPPSYAVARISTAAYAFGGLVYLVWTWRHPRLDAAFTFAVVGMLGIAGLIAWSAWVGAQIGERWQSVAAAQLVVACIPLVAPLVWVGYLLIGVYAAELVLIMLYQQHAGLGPLPGAEPFGSLTIVAISLAVLTLRNQRERIGLAYIRTTSETTALVRLAPMVATIRDEIEPALHALDTLKPTSAPQIGALARSIQRLSSLRDQLRALSVPTPHDYDEEPLLAKESQEGVIITALAGIVVMALGLWGTRELPLAYTPVLLWCLAIDYIAVALWMWSTRRHPTLRRGLLAGVLLLAPSFLVAGYIHFYWSRMDVPAFPFTGPKLLMMILVLMRFPRLWIGVALLALLLVTHVVIELGFSIQPAELEPWHTLVFAVLGLGFLFMGEQRRIASLALLRAEATQSALHRRANLSLALCDQLNTPLQTLVGVVSILPPSASATEVSTRIDILRASSCELARLTEELPPEFQRASLDSALELKPRY